MAFFIITFLFPQLCRMQNCGNSFKTLFPQLRRLHRDFTTKNVEAVSTQIKFLTFYRIFLLSLSETENLSEIPKEFRLIKHILKVRIAGLFSTMINMQQSPEVGLSIEYSHMCKNQFSFRNSMSGPRATSRSTSLVWSRRGWRG